MFGGMHLFLCLSFCKITRKVFFFLFEGGICGDIFSKS